MSPSTLALVIIFAIVGAGSALGLYAGSRHKMDIEQWAVGGRGFGTVLVWLLMAGEVYTTFSLLGASGWAYSRGAPIYYSISYITLAYAVSFFILPQIWEVGRKYSLHTESDFFSQRYRSKRLGAFVAVISVAFIIPYLQLQLTGLGIIVEVASFGGIGRTPAILISVALVAAFVFAGGIRAVAWVSVLKDTLMVFVALFIGIAIPYIYFGGIGRMFTVLAESYKSHLVMPGTTGNMGHAWYISTVVLTSLGFYMWPHLFGAGFTAKSADTVRRNAVIMPLYTITLPLVFLTGFAAILVVPGLQNGDLAFLTIVRQTFPAWFLGIVGGAGALTAMVPAAILILTGSTLFAKNFYCQICSPEMSDAQLTRLARITVVVLSIIAAYFAIFSTTTLVGLLLLGYAGVAQFFPGIVFGLYWRRVTALSVFAGIIVGVCTAAGLVLSHRDPFYGLNAGFIALCLNLVTTVVLSLVMPPEENGFEEEQAPHRAQVTLQVVERLESVIPRRN